MTLNNMAVLHGKKFIASKEETHDCLLFLSNHLTEMKIYLRSHRDHFRDLPSGNVCQLQAEFQICDLNSKHSILFASDFFNPFHSYNDSATIIIKHFRDCRNKAKQHEPAIGQHSFPLTSLNIIILQQDYLTTCFDSDNLENG